MSLAGRPKTIARNARADAVAKARAEYTQVSDRVWADMRRLAAETLAPYRAELMAKIDAADIVYFEAIGDTESARLLKERQAA